MKVIKNTQELNEVCKRFSVFPFITVDTEFLRETTFWPQLCLIQLAAPNEECIIDPLADGIDLSAFFDLMANQKLVKVFHAARQDIEIIYNLAQVIPTPLFDTQIAAMVCGFGDSVSYRQLVKKVTQVDLDKTSRFTDWARRPLSNKQLTYALGDVTHLRDIYKYLSEQLEKTGRSAWLVEEMDILTDPQTYLQHPEQAWKRLKMRVKTPKSLAILKELAAWREREAQRQDIPRGRVIKDDIIYDLANQAPKSIEELARLRSVHDGFARSSKGKDIVKVIADVLARDPKDFPTPPKTKPLPAKAIAVIDLLRVLLKTVAAEHDVAPKLIATVEDLEKIALYSQADVVALKGWRYDLFGADALDLKRGKLCLTIRDGEIVRQSNTQELDGLPKNKLKQSLI